MKYEEILKLLDKGFTPDQVMQLASAPEPQPEPVKQEEPVPVQLDPPETPVAVIHEKVVEEQPEPEWAKKLNENITGLKNAIHAQNIQQDLGKGEKKETPEDVMMAVLGGGSNA